MKHKTLFVIPYLAGLLLSVAGTSAYADLTISEVVGNFNSMNGEQGLTFSYYKRSMDDYVRLSSRSGERVDTGAYHSSAGSAPFSSAFWIYTFAVDAHVSPLTSGTAMLNYDPTTGYTNTIHNGTLGEKIYTPLNLGAAYLYKYFASTDYESTAQYRLNQAFIYLMGPRATLEGTGLSNLYVQVLLHDNPDLDFWRQPYDARNNYDGLMGNYVVLVMNTYSDSGAPGVNYLYLAQVSREGVDDVPEPATLLLWALGGIGLIGASWSRQRRRKKSVFA